MQFRVLGPMEVVGDDGPTQIGRGQRRMLLGLLLLHANEVVAPDQLIAVIWSERPPTAARSALHVLVSDLRKALGDGGAEMLLTQPSGYVLKIAPDELDLTLFERLLTAGRNALAAADPETAEQKLRDALALWRGPPLQDFAYDDFAQSEIARLDELHLAAEEELIDAELARGHGKELVPKLEALITENPVGCTNSVVRCGAVPDVGWLGGGVASALPSLEAAVLVSFVYVVACRLFALLLLLARGDRSKELELLVLRHELSILRRQARRPQLTESDRLALAVLSRVMPRRGWQAFHVRPETLLCWHRRIVARRWTYPHRRPGRPPVDREVRQLIVRLARENSHWGYVRIVGELRKLGITASATLVRNVLARAGIPPAPKRAASSWRSFLRQHENTILACDLFTVDTVWLRRLYMLFFVAIGTRRVEYIACTSKPDTAWMTQQARNLLMDLDDRSQRPRFLIHDRDTKFSRAFDAIFRSEGIKIVQTPIQAPNANAYAERWVGSVRRECLDRLLIFGRRQLEHVLRVYIRHFNQQRPHRALDLRPPDRISGPDPSPTATLHPLRVRRRDLLGGLLHEYEAAA